MANPAYDIYEPLAGGFRARLGASLAADLVNGGVGPIGVSLNATGRAVKGTAAQSGLVGILVKNVAHGPISRSLTGINQLHGGTPNPNAPIGVRAGDAVDIMTNGTIINLNKTTFPAGSKIYCAANGTLSATSAVGSFLIGFTVDAGHLVVRFTPGTPAVE